MSEPFVGEIKFAGFNFAPRGYALCNGQILTISQNTALFAILGATYGGNGSSTFGLPNLQGRSPMHWGQGTGLTSRSLGEQSGSNSVTLTSAQTPSHTHSLQCNTATTGNSPSGATFSGNARLGVSYAPQGTAVPMNAQAVQPVGGNQPHNNMQPYLGMTFIIALQGIFPQRS